jgi:hypothetical protein
VTRRAVLAAAAVLLLGAGTYGAWKVREAGRWRGLRQEPAQELSAPEAGRRLRELGLFEANRNPAGRGVAHAYELQAGGQVVYDRATGLAWQKEGSERTLRFDKAQEYVARLNESRFAGASDWRLPTLEEAMSLMEPERRAGGLHLDPAFGPRQWWIWTADRESAVGVWVVYFYGGSCFVHVPLGGSTYVRAVRRPARPS